MDGPTVNKFVGDFVKTEVDNYLHKHTDVADVMLQKIQESEKERTVRICRIQCDTGE